MTGPVDYSDWQWLRIDGIDKPFRCPPGAIGHWTGRGWELCDEPDVDDGTKDPAVPDSQVAVKAPAASKTKQPAAPAHEGSE